MHAHDRAVDHLHVAVVRFHDGIHQAIPDSRLAPAVEAIVGRRVGPVSLGHVAPLGAPVRSTQKMPLSTRRFFFRPDAAPLPRQQRLDDAPLEVREIVAHDPGPDVWERESLFESRV